jgi:phage shock protein PspC (stress-responsive transcriptional regulator)/uncharacterized membrane protein
MVGGVISGLAAYTGWDVTLLRILFVVLVCFTAFFPFVLLYIIIWIVAPEARTASDRLSMKGEPINIETIKEATENVTNKATNAAKRSGDMVKSSAPTGLRILLGFFGIMGFLIFIPMLIAFIPLAIISSFSIAAATIAMKPLFVATAILICTLLFTIVSIGITISTALVAAKLSKSAAAGLAASTVLAIVLVIASSITGGIWAAEVGKDGVRNTVNELIRDAHIEVNGTDSRVKVDVGPIHIDTHK